MGLQTLPMLCPHLPSVVQSEVLGSGTSNLGMFTNSKARMAAHVAQGHSVGCRSLDTEPEKQGQQ